MSLLMDARAECLACGLTTPVRLAASVNADRRPDLRQDIMDGTFQVELCTCGELLRLPLHLSYLDLGRGQWILAESADRLAEWSVVEQEAGAAFELSYGAGAPALARELGADLEPRLVFGWPALREKLLIQDLVLDDVTLELLKLAVIRDVPGPPLADQTELRLTGGDILALRLAWIECASETELAALSIDTAAYDAIAAAPIAWSAPRDALEDRLFVDYRRLIFA
jgi:hypothetical protein